VATLFLLYGRPGWAAAMDIVDIKFTLISDHPAKAIRDEFIKRGWVLRNVRMATRDECECLPGFEEATGWFKQERLRKEEKKREEEELAATIELEKRLQRDREIANRRRQQEENAARMTQAIHDFTGGAAFVVPENVSDAKLRATVECVIEKAKLLLGADDGEGLLDSICASVVDVRVNLASFPALVSVVDDLYIRLTEIIAGRKRDKKKEKVSGTFLLPASPTPRRLGACT
jgi:hypothetical protein